jgi:hypothetical protein
VGDVLGSGWGWGSIALTVVVVVGAVGIVGVVVVVSVVAVAIVAVVIVVDEEIGILRYTLRATVE